MWMEISHGVQEPGHLPLGCLDDARIGMTGGGDPKGRGQVEIRFPVGIPDVHALGALPDDGPGKVRFDERHVARFEGAEQFEDFC